MAITRRPLTARGVIASSLLGTKPPELSARRLVRVGELFGISGGTIRVALSRMVSNGELMNTERGYRLSGALLERQQRQESDRTPITAKWSGDWTITAVMSIGLGQAERAALRSALQAVHLAELREGMWLRPANLAPGATGVADGLVGASCITFTGRLEEEPEASWLAAHLWDLDGWTADAEELCSSMNRLIPGLDSMDVSMLAPGFIESAAVLRLLAADPMLPTELAPSRWPSGKLRQEYKRFDGAYRLLLRRWLDAD